MSCPNKAKHAATFDSLALLSGTPSAVTIGDLESKMRQKFALRGVFERFIVHHHIADFKYFIVDSQKAKSRRDQTAAMLSFKID